MNLLFCVSNYYLFIETTMSCCSFETLQTVGNQEEIQEKVELVMPLSSRSTYGCKYLHEGKFTSLQSKSCKRLCYQGTTFGTWIYVPGYSWYLYIVLYLQIYLFYISKITQLGRLRWSSVLISYYLPFFQDLCANKPFLEDQWWTCGDFRYTIEDQWCNQIIFLSW
jgi:hypothetical protein